uniref:PGG domain-containing protein n=2 Tax=Manihot esculenta TaxID=3983 RepID=A0A2C9VKF3_MANES
MRSFQDGDFWQKEIVNWKNKQGNAVLHIAATLNQSLAIKQLMKTCICLNNKNSDGLTAMEVLGDQALVISHRDKTKIQRLSCRKLHLPTARMNFRSPTLFRANVRIQISRITKISNEPSRFSNTNRYSNLQAALSPPGGVWQGTADTKSPIRANVHVDNTSEASPSSRYVGTTIMNTATFSVFWTVN